MLRAPSRAMSTASFGSYATPCDRQSMLSLPLEQLADRRRYLWGLRRRCSRPLRGCCESRRMSGLVDVPPWFSCACSGAMVSVNEAGVLSRTRNIVNLKQAAGDGGDRWARLRGVCRYGLKEVVRRMECAMYCSNRALPTTRLRRRSNSASRRFHWL